MNLDFGFLAEAAVDKGGQLFVLGTFDRIKANTFPFAHPHFALVLKISAHPTEIGKHTFELALLDADRRPVKDPKGEPYQIGGELKMGENKMGTWVDSTAQLVLNIGNMRFPRPDTYCFSLKVDGHHLGDVRFFVVDAEAKEAVA